jgi:putative ABC transport system permease protein
VRAAAAAARRNRSRAFGAAAMVAVGVASLVVVSGIDAAARRDFEAVADRLAPAVVTIRPATVRNAPRGRAGTATVGLGRLTARDVLALREAFPAADFLPIVERSLTARWQGRTLTTSVRGAPLPYAELRRFRLARGRGLSAADEVDRARVAVLGAFVAARLGNGASLVGHRLWVAGVPFEVIGELEAKGVTGDGQNEDDQILVPATVAPFRLWNSDEVSRILVRWPGESSAVAHTAAAARSELAALRSVLRASRGLDEAEGDDFEIDREVKNAADRDRGARLVRGVVRSFRDAALALGAAGVLCLSALDVRDRRGEIGLRRAVGARRRDIARGVLLEAVLSSVAGGLAGIAVGASGLALGGGGAGWDARSAALGLVAAIALGTAGGVAPAIAAARVTPLQALRDS